MRALNCFAEPFLKKFGPMSSALMRTYIQLNITSRYPSEGLCVGSSALLGVSFLEAQRGQKVAGNLQRCGHPGQQHGLRMPPRSLSMPTSMRRFLVSSFLADVTQQIHSFRASGVISVQRLFAAALDSMAFRISAGSLCTVPPAIL
jgi:hypothetical protein